MEDLRRSWEDSKIEAEELGSEGVERLICDRAHGRSRWRNVQNTVMTLRGSVKCGQFEIFGRPFRPVGPSRHASAVPRGIFV